MPKRTNVQQSNTEVNKLNKFDQYTVQHFTVVANLSNTNK